MSAKRRCIAAHFDAPRRGPRPHDAGRGEVNSSADRTAWPRARENAGNRARPAAAGRKRRRLCTGRGQRAMGTRGAAVGQPDAGAGRRARRGRSRCARPPLEARAVRPHHALRAGRHAAVGPRPSGAALRRGSALERVPAGHREGVRQRMDGQSSAAARHRARGIASAAKRSRPRRGSEPGDQPAASGDRAHADARIAAGPGRCARPTSSRANGSPQATPCA